MNMAINKGSTWYRLPEGKDPSIFKNWKMVDAKDVPGLQVPPRSCFECKANIAIEEWMQYKHIPFLNAAFDFVHAGLMVCPSCWEKIEKGLSLPAIAPNGGTRAVPRVGDAQVVSSGGATVRPKAIPFPVQAGTTPGAERPAPTRAVAGKRERRR
jgi:hypothetical protein